MSFSCPWQNGTLELCRRTGDTACLPGKPGCVLYRKVTFAEELRPAEKPRRRRRKPKPEPGSEPSK